MWRRTAVRSVPRLLINSTTRRFRRVSIVFGFLNWRAKAMETNQSPQAILNERPGRKAKRRGQRGSILRRGSSWSVVYRTPDGKQKWQGGFRTKEDAQKQVDIILGSIRENRYIEPKEIIFREFCDDWMSKAKAVLKPKTWASYQSALKNWDCSEVWRLADLRYQSRVRQSFQRSITREQGTQSQIRQERSDSASQAFRRGNRSRIYRGEPRAKASSRHSF